MFTFEKAVTQRCKHKIVKSIFDPITGSSQRDAERASRKASQAAVGAQREALDYYKQQMALPTEYRDKAMTQLWGMYGQDPTQNPMYQAQMANIGDMTQRAIDTSMATAAATGGLRGGNLQQGFADIANQQTLAQNQALADAHGQQMQGLQSFAGMPTGAGNIAQMMSGIGQTQAQGITGAYQSGQAAQQAGMGNLMGLASLGLQGAAMFSDKRLKDNLIKTESTIQPGINKYTWTWNEHAEKFGLHGDDSGYLAQEVELVWPELVRTHPSGYKQIDTRAIDKRLEVSNG